MKQRNVATNSSEVVQAVGQRLTQHKLPTIAQTKDLLEQIAIAEVEIGLLRSALAEASATLEIALLSLSRQEQDELVLDQDFEAHSEESVLSLYQLLLNRAWERNHELQERALGEQFVEL